MQPKTVIYLTPLMDILLCWEMVNMFKIDNEFKNANISRTVRFTEPLFEELNAVAAQNDISFNLLVLQCCKYALENREED